MAKQDGERLHHLDAIRVSAILLLIPYHAARYLQKSNDGGWLVDAGVWFVHTWHMPLFFAISGFLAADALRRSDAVRQLRGRLRRLGLPLFVGMLTIVPLANFLVIEMVAMQRPAGAIPARRQLELGNIFTPKPHHLWFIAYLLVISLLAIGVWLLIRRTPQIRAALREGFARLMRSPWLVPAMASLGALILLTKTGWVAGGSAAGSLVPTPTLLAYFSLFFCFGWLLSGQGELLSVLRRGAWARLGAGVALAIPAAWLFYENRVFTGNVGHPGPLAEYPDLRPLGLLVVGLVCWLTLLGIWGVLARHVRGESATLRYLSAASFTIYLIHIPFLVTTQTLFKQTGMPVLLRYPLTVLATLLLALIAYAAAQQLKRLRARGRARKRALATTG